MIMSQVFPMHQIMSLAGICRIMSHLKIQYRGCNNTRGRTPHVAAGIAYAKKYRKSDGAVLTTFGDGATSTPDFHVAMNFAGVYDLPMVFLCENNGFAISVPTYPNEEGQSDAYEETRGPIYKKAEAYGFEGIRIDGTSFWRFISKQERRLKMLPMGQC